MIHKVNLMISPLKTQVICLTRDKSGYHHQSICPLKQLFAPRHGGLGGKNNGRNGMFAKKNALNLMILSPHLLLCLLNLISAYSPLSLLSIRNHDAASSCLQDQSFSLCVDRHFNLKLVRTTWWINNVEGTEDPWHLVLWLEMWNHSVL